MLVIPRVIPTDPALPEDRKLMAVLDQIEQGGWELVAIVEPERYLEALRLVLDGLADVVVVTRPEDFPVIQLASNLNISGRGWEERTQIVPRPASEPRQRPRLVGPEDRPEPGARREQRARPVLRRLA